MIDNATLKRIDRRTVATATGQEIFTPGPAIEIRCFSGEIKNDQKWTLGATIKDASGVVYVPEAEMAIAGETAPANGDIVAFCVDEELDEPTEQVGQIVAKKDQVLNGISHFELYVKRV